MQRFTTHISKFISLLTLLLFASSCNNQSSTTMPSHWIDVPITIYGANNGNFIRYDYKNRSVDETSLNIDLFPPSYRAAYWELKIDGEQVLLSGNKNLVVINKENLNTLYFPLKKQPCYELDHYTSTAGINPFGMELFDGKPVLIQNLGILDEGNKMVLNLDNHCIAFDDLPYSINAILVEKENTFHTFLHQQTLYLSETSTKKPQKIIEKIYDKEGNFIQEEVYNTGVQFLGLQSYIEVGNKKLALLTDDRSIYLSLLSTEGDGRFIYLEGDPRGTYGPGLWGATEFKVVEEKLYLFIEDRVYKIDISLFQIEEEFILSEVEEPSTIHGLKFTDEILIWVGWDEMYVYDLETFSLIDRGPHGINFYYDDYTVVLDANR